MGPIETKANETLRRDLREENGMSYRYELTAQSNSEISLCPIKTYSFIIELTDESGAKTQAKTSHAFSDERKALKFYEKLVLNLATPINLAYVAEDELTHQSFLP